jgi:2-polyprenyl-3-methyl-5-hydroxy-6-metoxy-1,4-benzoquinol methylase
MWAPDTQRVGAPLSLEEALKLENRVFALRKELRCYEPLGDVVPESKMNEKQTQDAWEGFSEHWMSIAENESRDEGDPNRRFIIDPPLMRLVGDVEGLSVLDAGCGNGYLSRRLARDGAFVTGVDFSGPFIEYCNQRETRNSLGITFTKASLDDLSVFEDGIFDLVVSNIVMVDVVNFQQAFREISRVLKDEGRFIWSNTHPVFGRAGSFDIRLPSDTHRPEERYLKLVDRYYDSGGVLFNWDGHNLWQIDRTLEEYSKALKEAGFVISEIIEPRASPEDIREYPRHLAFDADRWTHFIIYECLKRP